MTTSDPRADRDDDAREHRTIGQRIRDAVLGDPADDRRDDDREYAPYEQATREHVDGGAVPDPVRDDIDQDGNRRAVADRTGDGYGDEIRAAGTGGAAGGRETRDFTTSSYDPDRDTGYVGEDRANTDRTTGHRYTDYDTGRVDTARVDTARVDTGRGGADTVRGTDYDSDSGTLRGSTTGATLAAGGAAAAGVAAAHHGGARDDVRFSEVDDTTTVGPSRTGRVTRDTGAESRDRAADDRAEAVAGEAGEAGEAKDSDRRERLVPAQQAQEYSSRWDALKGDFVDEPRRAVAQADDLVGELLDEIQRLFADQRRDLEQGFDHDRASTEDLRLALRRYRSFFDRLLSF